MKRVGNLFPTLIGDANILQAICEVNRTHKWGRHHRRNQTVLWVERTLPERVEELRHILSNGFKPSPARRRTIYDKSGDKYREIYEPKLWPDQYVHHCLVQVIRGPVMHGMDHYCCGSIPGRGTIYGMKAIKKWMATDRKRTKYCAELDIHHFYQTLHPRVVMAQLCRIIKDKRVLRLCYETLADGVPIGCYCSQWFANAVLEPLDHIIREKLGIDHYVRYMDNLTLFCANKKRLHKAVREIDRWLRSRGMCLKSNWQVFPTRARLPNAMGYRYGRGYTLPRKKTLLRFKRACKRVRKRIAQGREPTYHQACGIVSRAGWLVHCDSHKAVKKWLSPIGIKRLKNIIRKEARRWAKTTAAENPAQCAMCV